jgi:hypothetical protein
MTHPDAFSLLALYSCSAPRIASASGCVSEPLSHGKGKGRL